MADRNKNFLQGTQNEPNVRPVSFEKSEHSYNNNNNSNSTNNNRINVNGDCSPTCGLQRDESGESTEQNCFPKPVVGQKEQAGYLNNYQPKRAPIVGWQNGSPTVFPSSPSKSPDRDTLDKDDYYRSRSYTTTSRTSGIYQDTSNTEDLSLADEKLFQSTPSRTIDRSIESLSPDKDTFLTTSPEIGRSKDLSLGEELGDQIDLLSPETDFTEDRMPATSIESYLTSANPMTSTSSSTEKCNPDDLTPSNSSKERLLKQDKTVHEGNKSLVPEPMITSNPGYRDDDARDSIDSDSILDLEDASSKNKDRKKPKVPDGGWGWVVVVASLVVSMIADGVSFSFGLLYIEFLHEFGASKSKTAWIGSLFMAVPLLSGPIMSALVDRYGCRKMTIAGGLISGTGFVLSSFSNSIEVMYLTFGVIAGLGLGLCYVTAVVSIAYWFDKKRTLAVGLGACGTGIGTFLYAPMTTYFIAEYGWRGACLLLAGTFFNMIVCGSVMRDPEWWIIEQRKQAHATPKKSIARSECGRSLGSPNDEFPGVDELRRLLKSGQAPEYLLQSLSTSTTTPSGPNNGDAFRSVVNLPTFVKQSEKVPLEVLESLSSNSRLYNVILENYPSLLPCRSFSDKKLYDSSAEVANKSGVTMSMRIKQAPGNTKTEAPKTKCASPGAAKKSVKSSANKKLINMEPEEADPLLAKELAQAKWYGELLDLLQGMMDFSMFLELHFLLLSLSTILLFTWFIVPYFYLAEHLTRNGYTESDAANLLSVIGITNTIGMIALGWAGDQPWMNVSKTYAWCLAACGLATIFMSIFTSSYILLITTSAAFGLFFASNFSFTPVILVELIPLERFTTAYGLTLLCQGIGNLLGPPLAGWIFDITQSWDLSFYMAGGWIIVSGIFVGLIPYTKNRKIWGKGPIEMERDRDSLA